MLVRKSASAADMAWIKEILQPPTSAVPMDRIASHSHVAEKAVSPRSSSAGWHVHQHSLMLVFDPLSHITVHLERMPWLPRHAISTAQVPAARAETTMRWQRKVAAHRGHLQHPSASNQAGQAGPVRSHGQGAEKTPQGPDPALPAADPGTWPPGLRFHAADPGQSAAGLGCTAPVGSWERASAAPAASCFTFNGRWGCEKCHIGLSGKRASKASTLRQDCTEPNIMALTDPLAPV